MLSYFCGTVTQKLCYNFQSDSFIQATSGVGVSSDVGEDGFLDTAKISDGLQIDIDLMVGYDGQAKVVFLKNLYAVTKDYGRVIYSGFVSLVMDIVLTFTILPEILRFEFCHVRIG